MIKSETLGEDWIMGFRKKPGLQKSDPAVIEKMIYALYLLENLAKQKLDFIFKGGTSLILITKESNRFSVDIDICSTVNRNKLEILLANVIQQSEFNSVELDKHRSYENTKIPKAHYSFSYQSHFNTNANYILLDILFQDNIYPEINKLEINTEWLITEEPFLKVATPSANSILGDKFTAFAPNTTGVPYRKGKELEIVKQLFDISMLINEADDYKIVDTSFLRVAIMEIGYRKLSITSFDVLNDIFNTALLIAKREKNKRGGLEKFNEIRTGLLKIQGFIIGSAFRIEKAIEASAKSAWFAMKLKNKNYSPIELYNPKIDVAKFHIENKDYQFLNKLKKANKPAFYYWYKCLEEIGELK